MFSLIPLKARAWLDLTERKAIDPQAVDGKQVTKHRNDVLRLTQLLADDVRVNASASIATDIGRFTEAVGAEVTTALLRNLEIAELPERLLARLRACYGVDA